MLRSYRFITIERLGDVVSVRLANPHVDDTDMEALGIELASVVDSENIKKIVICLGPEEPDCLISVFLAKLISLQRRLRLVGGELVLAHVSKHTLGIFRAAGIEKLFQCFPDQAAAVKALQGAGGSGAGDD